MHAACLYWRNLQHGHVILKLDFKNAFNCIQHDKMLHVVSDLAPVLVSFVYSLYSESSLFWEENPLLLLESVQQRDTLGPLLFCLTIYKLTSQLESKLRLFDHDDEILGGKAERVLHDLLLIEQGAKELGISLRHKV